MSKYRKKPVVIDAMEWNGSNTEELSEFFNEQPHDGWLYQVQGDEVEIHTLEGIMTASKGDFLIKGVSGEYYPCKPDIFEKTYEKVEE